MKKETVEWLYNWIKDKAMENEQKLMLMQQLMGIVTGKNGEE
jgi:hypothetical protein